MYVFIMYTLYSIQYTDKKIKRKCYCDMYFTMCSSSDFLLSLGLFEKLDKSYIFVYFLTHFLFIINTVIRGAHDN